MHQCLSVESVCAGVGDVGDDGKDGKYVKNVASLERNDSDGVLKFNYNLMAHTKQALICHIIFLLIFIIVNRAHAHLLHLQLL